MATPITRAEFQKLYGYTPKQETPDIETKPAPMPISRAEYEAMYKPKPQTAGENFSSNLEQQGRAQEEIVTKGAETQGRIKERIASGEVSPVKGLFQRFGSGLATTADLAYEGAKGAVKMALPPAAEKSVSDFLSGFQGAMADRVKENFDTLKASQDPQDQEIAKQISGTIDSYKTDETFRTDVNAAGGILNALFSAPVSNTVKGVAEAGVKTIAEALPEPKTLVKTIRDTNRLTTTQDTAIVNQAKDILKVEEKYQKSRNVNIKQGAGADESRMRIAQSNVLDGAVDTNGLIDTAEAVKMYRAQNIDGYEGTVKDILKNEGKTVDPRELRMDLRAGVLESGLEGATLLRALKGIDDHVRGLMVRSGDGRTIPLPAIQDAKVGEYKAINWQTKPNTATYKKTIARVYKEVIENNSDADIESINDELAKFYKDVERLNDLNGKRVEGGRLGKYGAQVTGTVVGAGAGMMGGGAGAAIGGIVGGELASALKGKAMAQTFKRGIKGSTPENAVLKQAKLKVPDKKVEAPKSITKTLEIKKVEKQIATNVNLQKKAIKENNYALVAELKDIYVSLVEKLKELIKDYKKNGIPLGMSIRKSVTPESVAKKSDPEDIKFLAGVIDDVKGARTSPEANKILDAMGLGRATDDELVSFAKEVIDEADIAKNLEVKAPTLLEEAKKYKSTLNLQDKNDLEELGRIFGRDQIEDMKNGKMTNWRGDSYEDLARVNIISEIPQTIVQKLEGKINPYELKNRSVYHGTTADNKQTILEEGFKKGSELRKGQFKGGGYDAVQDSISFSTDPMVSASFTGSSQTGVVFKTKLSDRAKIVTVDGMDYAEDLNDFIKELRKQKIDAVYLPSEKEIVVINPKIIEKIEDSREFEVYGKGRDVLKDF